MKEIYHKKGPEKSFVMLGKAQKVHELAEKGRETFPFRYEDVVGREGGIKYTLKRSFEPLDRNIKITTLDPNLKTQLINHPSIYIDGVISFQKGRGTMLLRLVEGVAKTEHIRYVYFATEGTNNAMINLAYRLGYTPFAMQGSFVYFAKDRFAKFKERFR